MITSTSAQQSRPAPKSCRGHAPADGHFSACKLALLVCAAFAFVACALAFCPPAQAASGTVYAGTLVRCYRHPVTGVIEDAGGENAYATGQGMVEGCLSTKAQMEVTDDGQYFLTIRLGLIDYTSKRSFKVQEWGASKWSKTKYAVSKKGKDTDGTTYDYCIKVPSAKCIVRMTMFVTPMGRSVVCYMYPKSLKKGKEKGMVAKIVTSASSGSAASTLEGGNDNGSTDDSGGTGANSTMTGGTSNSSTSSESSESTDSSDASSADSSSESSDASTQTGATGGASGLELSTDDGTGSSDESSEDADGDAGGVGMSPALLFAVIAGAIVVGGLVLLAITLAAIWYIRTRKNGWENSDPDDYAHAYEESVRQAQDAARDAAQDVTAGTAGDAAGKEA